MCRKQLVIFIIVIGTAFCRLYGQESHRMNDKEFFQVLNLNNPDLKNVKEKYEKGDFIAAKKTLVEYIKFRKNPKWHINWQDYYKPEVRNANEDLSYADRYAENVLLSCGTWYDFENNIDWTSNHAPDNYVEWTWHLNRLSHWIVLGRAYWATGNEKYAKAFVRQLNSWIDQCVIPQKFNAVGSAWRTIDTGVRASGSWPYAFYYFLSSSFSDDESVFKMIKSFYEHGVHLRTHNTSNNWLAIEMNGLFTIGTLFPEFKDSEEWLNYSVNRLVEEELKSFYPDGAQIELAPGYHELSVSNIVGVYKLAKLNGIQLPQQYVSRLEKAFEYYEKLMMPDGTIPALNDSRWLLSKDYFAYGAELFPQRDDFKYIATDGKEGKKPSLKSVWMPWAGWYVMRSGWNKDDYYALFEVGPYGAAHQHEDKLSFVLYAYGKRLITEAGFYPYDQSDWHKYALSARGHNVARVDGKDQNREAVKNIDKISYSPQPLDNKWISKRKYDYGEGIYSEGYGPLLDKTVTHNRTLKFVKNKYWVVTDTFTPSDTFNHTYDTWFHFSTPSYGINDELGVVYSDEQNSANIAIIALSGESTVKLIKGQKTPEIQGWLPAPGGSNEFHCEPIATPVYHISGKGVVQETYLFIPYKPTEKMPVNNVVKLANDKFIIYLKNGNKIYYNWEEKSSVISH